MNKISGLVRGSDGILMANVLVYAYKVADGTLLGSGLSGDGTIYTAGDEYYNDVTLLLHCDGADGTTDFIDHSPSPKTVTAYGNAQITILQSKFGGAAAYFDGAGDCLDGGSDWLSAGQFGTGSFTFECWVYAVGAPNNNQVIWTTNNYPSSTGLFLTYSAGNSNSLSVNCGTTALIVAVGGWSYNAWHHVAVVRSGTTLYLFVDGINQGSTTWNNNCSDGLRYIGRPSDTDNYAFQGYLDDIRITKGVARYTANFTPPTETFYDNALILARPEGQYTILTEYADKVICTCNNSLEAGLPPLVLRTTPVPV